MISTDQALLSTYSFPWQTFTFLVSLIFWGFHSIVGFLLTVSWTAHSRVSYCLESATFWKHGTVSFTFILVNAACLLNQHLANVLLPTWGRTKGPFYPSYNSVWASPCMEIGKLFPRWISWRRMLWELSVESRWFGVKAFQMSLHSILSLSKDWTFKLSKGWVLASTCCSYSSKARVRILLCGSL